MSRYQAHHCVRYWTPSRGSEAIGRTASGDAFKPVFTGLYLVMTQYA
jgi:hypothetical protein